MHCTFMHLIWPMAQRTTIFELRPAVNFRPPLAERTCPLRDVRYTLTYAHSFLYVRLGNDDRAGTRSSPGGESGSMIVCLGLISEKKTDPTPLVWMLRPPKADKEATTIFEGTPLVYDGKLYTVVWKQSGGTTTTSIVCYQMRGLDGAPELLWQQEVGRPGFGAAIDVRARNDLLTLAGPNVVFCTNAGNVIALDARSGKAVWEYRYTPNPRRAAPVGRDLCPCLFDGSHIFAAPADSDRLLCLDAFTGRLCWDREGVDVVHLLGVAHGRLIATFAGPMKGIRGIQVAERVGKLSRRMDSAR